MRRAKTGISTSEKLSKDRAQGNSFLNVNLDMTHLWGFPEEINIRSEGIAKILQFICSIQTNSF